MTARKVLLGIGALIVVVAVFVIYEVREVGLDHTGVPLDAPTGEPVVRSAPTDWATEQAERQATKAAFLQDKAEAFDWFARFPFSQVDGIPLIILKLLPTVAPHLWEGGDDFLSNVGLFADARFDNKMLPTGVGFSGLSRAGSNDNIDYTSFTCAACHIGRVDTGNGQLEPIIGGINSEFNINLFFLKLHQTIEHLYAGEEDASKQAEQVRVAFLSALDQAIKTSDTFFYEDFSWNACNLTPTMRLIKSVSSGPMVQNISMTLSITPRALSPHFPPIWTKPIQAFNSKCWRDSRAWQTPLASAQRMAMNSLSMRAHPCSLASSCLRRRG
jgi:hypothetical protein